MMQVKKELPLEAERNEDSLTDLVAAWNLVANESAAHIYSTPVKRFVLDILKYLDDRIERALRIEKKR